MIRVALAEDHNIVRQGLRLVLESAGDITIVAEVDDGLHVVETCARTSPDVLVLDLGLPGLHGLEVIRQVTRRMPVVRVLVLSMHPHEEYVRGALANGARGYLLKGCHASELLEAVRRVASGDRYLDTEVPPHLRDALQHPGGLGTADPYEMLTRREREVLQLMAEGHTNAAIAARLFVSIRTVETHRANILRKLHLRNQTDVVLFAVRRGILPPV
jgi:DNA-binding NarL/FixJ family response regulator